MLINNESRKFLLLLFLILITIRKKNSNKKEIPKEDSINQSYFNNGNELLYKLKLTNELLEIYSSLYDYIRNGYIKPKFRKINNLYELNKGNICICTIGKYENLYIREFVDYYHSIGITKIFLYDNNNEEAEKFEDAINDYIKSKFVEITNVRGLVSIQIPIFNYCYHKNKNYCDWIGFLDIDEYLYFENSKNIEDYFLNSKFSKCEVVFFNWIIYNDNNLIKYENRSLINRFVAPKINFTHGKAFVRGNMTNLMMATTHIPGINAFQFCNSNGDLIYPNNFFGNKFEKNPKAYIKHYYTKTVEEFCKKINKGDAHFNKNHPQYNYILKDKLKLFFKLNKMTKEKINILENCLKMNFSNNFSFFNNN